MKRLHNKTCVITGAARGIGAAIAKAFKNEGAIVVITDIDYQSAQETATKLGTDAFELDVTNEDHWDALQERWPEIDALVNNAGITGFEDSTASQNPEFATLEDWRRVHRVNLDGTFLGCRYGIKAIRGKNSGAIINISSRSGMVGIPQAAAYASSKAAI